MQDVPYLLPVAYREQIPMTFDLYKLRETGTDNPAQWQFAAKKRPAEEFYDSNNDPWEFNNLIDDPKYQDKIAEMRKHLDAWIKDTGDLGFILPETKLVKEKIWPPDGKQPTTPAAEIEATEQKQYIHHYTVTLSCDDPGASIGYRVGDGNKFNGPWMVYTDPVKVGEGQTIQVQTHRIGHKPNTVVKKIGGE